MLDRLRGCVFGLACGDALGYPTEFMVLESIRERYGPTEIVPNDLEGKRYAE